FYCFFVFFINYTFLCFGVAIFGFLNHFALFFSFFEYSVFFFFFKRISFNGETDYPQQEPHNGPKNHANPEKKTPTQKKKKNKN
ncbi:hypothetical protein KXT07_24745, partial [Salmonella enterica subsp. enterica serovar Weltevreden]|nr:hypothetical protein [Salmonella enterica subsp. enterica serovar Weltevreden]